MSYWPIGLCAHFQKKCLQLPEPEHRHQYPEPQPPVPARPADPAVRRPLHLRRCGLGLHPDPALPPQVSQRQAGPLQLVLQPPRDDGGLHGLRLLQGAEGRPLLHRRQPGGGEAVLLRQQRQNILLPAKLVIFYKYWQQILRRDEVQTKQEEK